MRFLLIPLCLCAALLAATPAWAEEVFVLDNGNVVRGRVVRESEDEIVIRLSGFVNENRITLRPSEVVRRFTSVDPNRKVGLPETVLDEAPDHAPLGPRNGVPRTIVLATDLRNPHASAPGYDLPNGEVAMESEGFFARLRRVSLMALPESLEGRMVLGFLLLVVMTVLVAGGTRMLGMKAVSLHASTSLGLLLGVFLVIDILWSEDMLRADRAVWIVPLQAVIWLFVARSTLDAPLSRTVPLFSMVLFASTCFVWATGSLLVSV